MCTPSKEQGLLIPPQHILPQPPRDPLGPATRGARDSGILASENPLKFFPKTLFSDFSESQGGPDQASLLLLLCPSLFHNPKYIFAAIMDTILFAQCCVVLPIAYPHLPSLFPEINAVFFNHCLRWLCSLPKQNSERKNNSLNILICEHPS